MTTAEPNFCDGCALDQLREWAISDGGVKVSSDQFSVKDEKGEPKFYNDTIEVVEIYREPSGNLNVIARYHED